MYKVFIVDDEPIILEGLKSLLDWEGYGLEVIGEANDGEEAFKKLKETPCDLLITDIMMPNMTGLQLIEKLKAIHPHTKCVVLTGYQEFDYVKKGIELGIENYLLKPVDSEELTSTVRNIVEKLNQNKQTVEEKYILRDNVIWRWLNEEIDELELKQRLGVYNIQLSKQLFYLSYIQIDAKEGDTFFNRFLLRKRLENVIDAIFVIDPSEGMIVLWMDKDQNIVEQDLGILMEMVKKESWINHYWITKSESFSIMNNISGHFSQIKQLSEFRAVLSDDSHIITEELVGKFRVLSNIASLNEQELIQVMMKGDHEGIKKWIQSLFFQYSSLDSNHLTVLRGIAIDTISIIKSSISIPSNYVESAQIMQEILRCNCMSKLEHVLYQYCIRMLHGIEERNNHISPIIKSLVEYINKNFHEELSLKTLSHQFYINAVYLGQLFQKEMNVVFSDYVNDLRIQKAKELLMTTHLRAGEIGKNVGYSDPTYFYKQFKKNTGFTPTEYRSLLNSNRVV